MAKQESTAVNELIERMTTMKPLRPDPADDLMFREPAPPPRAAAPALVGPQARGDEAAHPSRRRSAHGTPSLPISEARGEAPPAAPPRHVLPAPRSMPVAAPFGSGAMRAQPAHAVAASMTLQLPRRRGGRGGKLIAPVIVLAIAGALGGGYLALQEQGDTASAPAAPAAVAAAPALAPAVVAAAPALVPAPARPAFVDVMIVSAPAGATVTLVDRGKTSFLGTTPISTALDPSRKYELVFSHPSMPTWVEPIDPSATRRVDVQLGRAGKPASRPGAAAAASPQIERIAPAARPAPRAAARPAPRAAAPALAPAGDGILMISSKPPCEILVDGKPTGLTTPQREIPLPAGRHQVTLVNKDEGIRKTIAVQITADQPTKVIQDLMK